MGSSGDPGESALGAKAKRARAPDRCATHDVVDRRAGTREPSPPEERTPIAIASVGVASRAAKRRSGRSPTPGVGRGATPRRRPRGRWRRRTARRRRRTTTIRVAEVRRRRHGAHLRGVAAEDARTPARGGVPSSRAGACPRSRRRGGGPPPGRARRDRRHAVGVPGEGARESRARVAGADQDDDVTRGVRAKRPAGAAPVREAGPVPVRRGGHGDGVVRARRGVRHGDRRVGTSDGHPGRSELSREHPGVRVLSRTATATARVACARHDAPSTSRRRSRRRGVRAAGT